MCAIGTLLPHKLRPPPEKKPKMRWRHRSSKLIRDAETSLEERSPDRGHIRDIGFIILRLVAIVYCFWLKSDNWNFSPKLDENAFFPLSGVFCPQTRMKTAPYICNACFSASGWIDLVDVHILLWGQFIRMLHPPNRCVAHQKLPVIMYG